MAVWTSPDLFNLLDVSGTEDYRHFSVLWFMRHAVAKTEARYQFHARPSITIVRQLRETDLSQQVCIRTAAHDWFPLDDPLSLLSLGIDINCPFFLKFSFSEPDDDARQRFHRVMDIFENYTESEEYRRIAVEKNENARLVGLTGCGCDIPDASQYQSEFDSHEQEFVLLKLVIENFILRNMLRIEEQVRHHTRAREIVWEGIDHVFRSILFEKGSGIFSLSNAYDNLMQIREVCSSRDDGPDGERTMLSYDDTMFSWSRERMEAWREHQNRRINYFYDRESVYYRDLFLCVLLRDPERMIRFNAQWGSRLDHSIGLRDYIDHELERIRQRLTGYLSAFNDPAAFREKLDLSLKTLKNDISEYTGFLKLIRRMRIYHV